MNMFATVFAAAKPAPRAAARTTLTGRLSCAGISANGARVATMPSSKNLPVQPATVREMAPCGRSGRRDSSRRRSYPLAWSRPRTEAAILAAFRPARCPGKRRSDTKARSTIAIGGKETRPCGKLWRSPPASTDSVIRLLVGIRKPPARGSSTFDRLADLLFAPRAGGRQSSASIHLRNSPAPITLTRREAPALSASRLSCERYSEIFTNPC